jgi:hypothetical protein
MCLRGLVRSSLLYLLVVLAPIAEAYDWEIEVVEYSKFFSHMTDRSLRLDAQGHPHIAYGEDGLYYAFHDDLTWHFEIVDSSYGVGQYASLVLDESGYPHISYHGYTDLKYAYRDTSGWHTEIADATGDVGEYTSIALDGLGRPHISYRWGNSLQYAYRGASGWHIELVVAQSSSGQYTSIALDGSGRPHISFGGDDDVKYAYRDVAGWHIETVDDMSPNCSSLVLDGSDRPHISYIWFNALRYAYRDGSSWHIQTADYAGPACGFPSLALDESGYPHISFCHYFDPYYDRGDLKYVYRDGTGWHTETVDTAQDDIGWTSLTLDESGYPHISYQGGHLEFVPGFWFYREMKYAHRDASKWYTETVDTAADLGHYQSLALDANGYPHISHYEYYGGDLRYGYRDASGWYTVKPDSAGHEGQHTSLVLDGSGWPHISYANGWTWNIGLKYAYCDAYGWHTETVDETESAGWFTSLALDGTGYPCISYCKYEVLYVDWWPTELRYAYRDAGIWHIEMVISGHEEGQYTSLALDGADIPHISYVGDTDLKYAHRDGLGWHIVIVDGAGDAHTSLELDGAGRPHISYAGDTNGDLKYACQDGSGWHIEVVDTAGIVGGRISLALDVLGRPHITYHEYNNGDLKYAYRDASGWHIETVDAEGPNAGCENSLALDGTGSPHISYLGLEGLKYARALPPATLDLTGSLAGGQLLLSWTPVPQTAEYWVYGASNNAFFPPGFAPDYQYRLDVLPSGTTVWASGNGIADPQNNWTYLIMAVDAVEQEMARSNYVGEHDFEAEIP